MTSGFIFPVTLFLSVPAAIVINYFVPPFDWLWQARLLLVPIVFLIGAMAFPFTMMLVFAIYTGVLWDLVEIPVLPGGAELRPGWSCLVLGLFGAMVNTIRMRLVKMRWEVHCLASAILTVAYLLLQYLYLTWVRGNPEFPSLLWWRIGGAGVAALFVAPVVFFILISIMQAAGYELPKEEQRSYH